MAVTARIDFGLAFFIDAFLNIVWRVPTTPPSTIAIYGIVLVVHALLNTFGVRIVTILNDVSVWWHIVGVAAIVVVSVVLEQHERTDIGTVFSTFVNDTGSGLDDPQWPGPVLFGSRST